jgi:hypothetical protein
MRAILHGGPCDGRVDENLRGPPPPPVYTCHEERELPPGWEEASDRREAPEVTYDQHRYRLVRTEGDDAHYEHAPDL